VHRARALCDKERLHGELEFIKTTFKENGYSRQQIQRALNLKVRTSKPKDKPISVTLLPYVQTKYGRLSRMLAKRNIKCGLAAEEDLQLPPFGEGRSAAEDSGLQACTVSPVSAARCTSDRMVGLSTPGLNSIAGTYGLGIQKKRRWRNIGSHMITSLDSKTPKSGYMDRLIREAIELELHSNNMHRVDDLTLSGSWKPLFRLLSSCRRHPPPPPLVVTSPQSC
jgi:hypothetical protein